MDTDYRMDWRTKERFITDIRKFTKRENELFELYCKYMGIKERFRPTGCDNTGRYLPLTEVTTRADFDVIEIKIIQKEAEYVHFKCNQVQSYIQQNAKILFFIDTPPIIRYAWIEPLELTKYPIVKFWLKDCYEVPLKDLKFSTICLKPKAKKDISIDDIM